MRWVGLLAGVLALGLSGQADAKTFRMGGATDDAVTILDVATIIRTENNVQAWATQVLRTDDGKSYDFMTYKGEWDCKGKRRRVLTGAIYDAKAKTIGNVTPRAWEDTIPDTAGDQTLDAACTSKVGPDRESEHANSFEAATIIGEYLLMSKKP